MARQFERIAGSVVQRVILASGILGVVIAGVMALSPVTTSIKIGGIVNLSTTVQCGPALTAAFHDDSDTAGARLLGGSAGDCAAAGANRLVSAGGIGMLSILGAVGCALVIGLPNRRPDTDMDSQVDDGAPEIS